MVVRLCSAGGLSLPADLPHKECVNIELSCQTTSVERAKWQRLGGQSGLNRNSRGPIPLLFVHKPGQRFARCGKRAGQQCSLPNCWTVCYRKAAIVELFFPSDVLLLTSYSRLAFITDLLFTDLQKLHSSRNAGGLLSGRRHRMGLYRIIGQ